MLLRTYRVTSLLLLVLLFSCFNIAHAGVLISPARLEAVVDVDGRTPGLIVVNRGPEPVVIRFSLAGGGHDLDGMPMFDESLDRAAALAQFVRISPTECALAPGDSKVISITASPVAGGLYPAVIADIIPVAASRDGIISNTRIAVPTLITGKAINTEDPKQAAIASQVVVSQVQPGGPLLLETIVHNTGDAHVRMGGRLTISGQGVREELYPKAVTILPGLARRIQSTWSPLALPPGEYIVEFVPDKADATYMVVAKSSFTVVRPYELAFADIKLEHLQASDHIPGSLSYQILLENVGNIGLQSQVAVQLIGSGGVSAAFQKIIADLAPGSGRLVRGTVDIQGVPAGDYLLQAVVLQGEHQLAKLVQPLRLSAAHFATR